MESIRIWVLGKEQLLKISVNPAFLNRAARAVCTKLRSLESDIQKTVYDSLVHSLVILGVYGVVF